MSSAALTQQGWRCRVHRNIVIQIFLERGDATMTERCPIFSTTGDQIGYTEGNAAFDLFDRRRRSYNSATGNLSDFTTGKLVGYVSFARNFVVPYADCGRAGSGTV